MKKALRRILVIALTMVMTMSMASTAFAAVYDPNMGGGTISSGDVDHDNLITFEAGTGYELTAQPGTTKLTNGGVQMNVSPNTVIPEKMIPGVTPADAYYENQGFAIKNADGKLEMIDLATYKFTKATTVYTVVKDVWPPYKDMKQDRSDWYYQYVRDMSIAGVVNGYPGYTFNPQGNVTWGESLKLIMLAAGYEAQNPVDSHWASGYLAKALEDGLVPADAKIDLGKPITRVEYARVAAKALGLKEVSIETPFADTDDMAVLELYSIKVVEGSFAQNGDRVFKPDDYITRAEMSTIVWRIYNYNATK